MYLKPVTIRRRRRTWRLLDEAVRSQALKLAESLRDRGWRIECHGGSGSLKAQLKRADKSNARFALLLGPDRSRARR